MSSSSDDSRYEQGVRPPKGSVEVTRRTVLASAVATTALAAVWPFTRSTQAEAADATSDADMVAFLLLSAALTGVHVATIAPEFNPQANDIMASDPGVDPINIKNEYFAKIEASDATTFGKLLHIAKSHPLSPQDIVALIQANDDTKFLARSIVLLWYLGSWYDPDDLKAGIAAPATRAFIASHVVSAKAYTQGLVWKIAQAHPMGYSNLQFGYWSRPPKDPNDSSELVATTLP